MQLFDRLLCAVGLGGYCDEKKLDTQNARYAMMHNALVKDNHMGSDMCRVIFTESGFRFSSFGHDLFGNVGFHLILHALLQDRTSHLSGKKQSEKQTSSSLEESK